MKNKKCTACKYYKSNMCVCIKPKVNRFPFGFPLSFNPKSLKCKSFKQREFEFDWDHL